MVVNLLNGKQVDIPAKAIKSLTGFSGGCEVEYIDNGELKTARVYEAKSRLSTLIRKELE